PVPAADRGEPLGAHPGERLHLEPDGASVLRPARAWRRAGAGDVALVAGAATRARPAGALTGAARTGGRRAPAPPAHRPRPRTTAATARTRRACQPPGRSGPGRAAPRRSRCTSRAGATGRWSSTGR